MGDGKKIVVEHVRVEDLPQKLREGLETGKLVRVTVEEETPVDLPQPKRSMRSFIGAGRGQFGTSEEIVEHVRKMRDEWDD
jgi:hypothetical protein